MRMKVNLKPLVSKYSQKCEIWEFLFLIMRNASEILLNHIAGVGWSDIWFRNVEKCSGESVFVGLLEGVSLTRCNINGKTEVSLVGPYR